MVKISNRHWHDMMLENRRHRIEMTEKKPLMQSPLCSEKEEDGGRGEGGGGTEKDDDNKKEKKEETK